MVEPVRPPTPADLLPLLPLRSLTLFPATTEPIELGRAPSIAGIEHAHSLPEGHPAARLLVVATQRDPMIERPRLDDLHAVAVLADVVQLMRGAPGRASAVLHGIRRIHLHEVETGGPWLSARVQTAHERLGDPTMTYALAGAAQDLVRQHDGLLPNGSKTRQRARALQVLLAERSPARIADMAAAHVDFSRELRISLLIELDVEERLRRLVEALTERIHVLQVKRDLDQHVREHLSRHEQEAILRHKLRAIQSELGEAEEEDHGVEDLERRIHEAGLPAEARAVAHRETRRLRHMNPQGQEATIVRAYLDWILDLPWHAASEDRLDVAAAKALLEREHFGLERVKRRIVQYLCVRRLAPDKRGPILCLSGPPGVGKTSLARSIAEALGRSFQRISLGGLKDDAELRGHRRTYVGALPGRLIQVMKRAGVVNPVILLDEVDKLGAPDLRGDPTGVLLEALDPEQNDAFEDHYLGIPYDLSHAIFVCTSNDSSRIPPVLRDRLEILELSGYTTDEKIAIARNYVLPRCQLEHGLSQVRCEIPDDVLDLLAVEYTRESGVRGLQQRIEALLRDLAMTMAEGRPVPERLERSDVLSILGPPRFFPELADHAGAIGVATGLGWTPTGGRLLFVEASRSPGDGTIRLTGKLGDVMQESGRAATSFVRANCRRLGIDPDVFRKSDVHVHLPSGGVPKDGPSAGVAVTAAVVSLLTGRAVRSEVAMTGEITLRGRVLPVGGVREKVLAAHRAGITEVVLPDRNRKDEPEIPRSVRDRLSLHFVSDIAQTLELVLEPAKAPATTMPATTTEGDDDHRGTGLEPPTLAPS